MDQRLGTGRISPATSGRRRRQAAELGKRIERLGIPHRFGGVRSRLFRLDRLLRRRSGWRGRALGFCRLLGWRFCISRLGSSGRGWMLRWRRLDRFRLARRNSGSLARRGSRLGRARLGFVAGRLGRQRAMWGGARRLRFSRGRLSRRLQFSLRRGLPARRGKDAHHAMAFGAFHNLANQRSVADR